jgi:hypothetical protein
MRMTMLPDANRASSRIRPDARFASSTIIEGIHARVRAQVTRTQRARSVPLVGANFTALRVCATRGVAVSQTCN